MEFTITKIGQNSRCLEVGIEKLPSQSKLLNFNQAGRKNIHQYLVEGSAT